MTVSLKHTKTSAIPDGGDTTLVQPSDWNSEHTLTLATGKLLGRSTAGTGAAEEITVGSGLTLAAGTLTASGGGSGTVTSVAALTLGTTGTDLTSTVADSTTTPVITLNVPTASASNRGALSSTDWTTFNNKGSGTVTSVAGTGTVNGITLTGTVTSTGSLTLGGTLSNVSLTTQVTGTLPVANGGTGAATLTLNNVLLGNGTSALQAVAPGASGNVLTSDGTTWGSSTPSGLAQFSALKLVSLRL